MSTWVTVSFWVSFLGFFALSVNIRTSAPYGKTDYMWKSVAEKQRFDLSIQFITIFGSIAIYTFTTWLLFLAN
jgi:hypothetical protein